MKHSKIRGLTVILCANLIIAPISYLNKTENRVQAQTVSGFYDQNTPSYSNRLVTGQVSVPDPVHQVERTDADGNFLQFGYEDDAGNSVNMEPDKQFGITSKKQLTKKGSAVTQSSYTSPYAVTSVKNQGIWSTCWAFAATAAIEANVIKNAANITTVKADSSLDLSESHLTWFGQNTYSTSSADTSYGDGVKNTDSMKVYGGSGGQDYKTAYYLARGSGMDLEVDAPYNGGRDIIGTNQRKPSKIKGLQMI